MPSKSPIATTKNTGKAKSIDKIGITTTVVICRENKVFPLFPIKKYIYDNYNDEISVDKLAEMVFMSASYLSSIFKRETGENLSYFIKAYRMEKAKEMLDDTVLKIGDISNNCGYPNVSYFCSTFRAHYGVSPQKYRELGSFTVKNVQNTHVI